ncbi:MAG: hypothetical protein R2856_32620 [Caldilineaceae bacterium]
MAAPIVRHRYSATNTESTQSIAATVRGFPPFVVTTLTSNSRKTRTGASPTKRLDHWQHQSFAIDIQRRTPRAHSRRGNSSRIPAVRCHTSEDHHACSQRQDQTYPSQIPASADHTIRLRGLEEDGSPLILEVLAEGNFVQSMPDALACGLDDVRQLRATDTARIKRAKAR